MGARERWPGDWFTFFPAWCGPAERTKTKREHRVPLSAGALAVHREAREMADDSGLVFPSARGRPLSEVAMPTMVRKLGIGAVPHGFRSSFRDWAAECTNAPREVCELALAHVNTNSIEAAYRRTDMFERRRALMEHWAAFLAGRDFTQTSRSRSDHSRSVHCSWRSDRSR